MNPPPPMLPASGSVTASANPTATAASTALPPDAALPRLRRWPAGCCSRSWRAARAWRCGRSESPVGRKAGGTRCGCAGLGRARGRPSDRHKHRYGQQQPLAPGDRALSLRCAFMSGKLADTPMSRQAKRAATQTGERTEHRRSESHGASEPAHGRYRSGECRRDRRPDGHRRCPCSGSRRQHSAYAIARAIDIAEPRSAKADGSSMSVLARPDASECSMPASARRRSAPIPSWCKASSRAARPALTRAQEGAEDRPEDGARDLDWRGCRPATSSSASPHRRRRPTSAAPWRMHAHRWAHGRRWSQLAAAR